jgi:hypothetical protein
VHIHVPRAVFLVGASCAAAAVLTAQSGSLPDLQANAKGAAKVVVATVLAVESGFDINAFGDQVIVSEVTLRVDETLKGPHIPSMSVVVEGGTVGDLTLEVSDLPSLKPQERAVFFLTEGPPGSPAYRPHGRGLGILTLDPADHVTGTDLTLDDVRHAVSTPER